MNNKQRSIRRCAICGEVNVPGSKDHIPPKSIFSDPLPLNLITVPACASCNNNGSDHDEIFKTFLAFILGLSPTTESLYKSAVSTASKKFSRYISQVMKPAILRTQTGSICGHGYTVPFNENISLKFETAVQRIVTGLFWHHFSEHIGKQRKFEIKLHYKVTNEMLGELNFACNKIGEQFCYLYTKTNESEPCISFWMLEFYERFWISCFVV